jgi:hypothetical protein
MGTKTGHIPGHGACSFGPRKSLFPCLAPQTAQTGSSLSFLRAQKRPRDVSFPLVVMVRWLCGSGSTSRSGGRLPAVLALLAATRIAALLVFTSAGTTFFTQLCTIVYFLLDLRGSTEL